MEDRLKQALDKIHAEDALKSHTKEYIAKKTGGYQKRKRPVYYKGLAAVTACFAVILLCWRGYSAYFMPIYTISVDVNPSIELGINQFDAVVSVESYNEDGNTVLSALDVRYLDYREALDKILADRSMEQYLAQDQIIAVMVFGMDENKKREMLAGVAACTGSYKNIRCSSGSSEEVDEAHAAGLSCGKYRAFLELQALDPAITVEDVKGLTMRQIRDRIDALSGDADRTIQNNSGDCGKNGYGRGTGCGRGRGRRNGQSE